MDLSKPIFLILLPALALAGCNRDSGSAAPVTLAAVAPAAPAKPEPVPSPAPAPLPAPEPLNPFRLPPIKRAPPPPKKGTKLTPSVIRNLVLNDDTSVLISLNNVYKAKEEITRAHTNLLPSINISAMVNSAGSFGLGGIGFLLPFLAPSNWFNLEIRKQQLAASGYAFYLVELNQYASAYSLYLSMLADEEILTQVQISYENIEQIRLFLENLYKEGKVSIDKLQQATARTQLAHMQVVQLRNTIANSRASLRRMLGFDLRREFFLEESHIGPVALEDRSPLEVLKKVFERSPEVRQIDSLIAAAQTGKYSVPFGFVGGAGGSLSPAGGPGAFTASGSVEFGFGAIPEMRLSELNIREYQLRRREIYLEQAKVIEQTLVSLVNAKAELEDAVGAEDNATKAYLYAQEQFALGKVSLTDVIIANELVVGTAISKIGSRLKVDSQRVNLQRILISNEFARIPDCKLNKELIRDKPFGWLANIFSRDRNTITVDQLCREQQD